MQRFLRVFLFLLLSIITYQVNAQADLEVFIFNDINGDGQEEGVGINGLAGSLTLYEDMNSDNFPDIGEAVPIAAVDGGGGIYTFSGITVGAFDFIVVLADQSPTYYVTLAASGSDPLDNDGDNDLDNSSWQTIPFTLTDGALETNVDIGLVLPARIGDLVWEDLNGNGSIDGAEGGFDWSAEGITITLTSDNGNTVDLMGNPFTVVDLGGGGYEFVDLPPDDYTLTFTDAPNDWFRTVTGPDNIPNPVTGEIANFTVQSDDNLTDFDAGYVQPGTIGDLVWEDLNGNGLFDGADAGFDWVGAGIMINLIADSGNTDDLLGNPFTVVDLGGGAYEFQNLPPDEYEVEFTQIPNNWYRTQDGGDSAPNQGTGFTTQFLLESGMMNMDQDAGYVQPVTIGDLVWEDFNGNGIFDGADAGFDWFGEGILINLTAVSGNTNNLDGIPFTAVNIGGGVYEFQNLAPDTYTIEFEQIVDNWYRTQDGGDSAPDQVSGLTASIILESGMTDLDQDAGYIQPARISDFVWEDLNGDGIQDGGEPGVDFNGEGILIEVTLLGGGAATDLDGNSPPVLTDLGGGMYEFDNLAPGDYEVTFGEIPSFWYLSLQNTTVIDQDSDPDPLTGLADNGGLGYTLMSGDINEDVDAAYVQPARISDFVWEDLNGDGLQDVGEPGVDGVDIMITDELGGGVTDLDGNALVMTTSGGGGLYEFLLLPPGDYILTVNTNVLTDYYLSLQDQAGGPGDGADVDNDSDGSQLTGETHRIIIESNEQQEDIDFGYFRSGTIEATVFHDSDGNGQNGTATDTPFAGMTVQLATNTGVTPVPNVLGGVVADQISDATGLVRFEDVPPGEYTLLYQLPGGWEFTYQDQSGFTTDLDDVNDDSDVMMGPASPGQSHLILLEGGETDDNSSVGIYKLMSIGNLVWIDSNGGDGTFDIAADNGAANVTVNLLYDADFDGVPETPALATTTTDAAGAYQFDDLIPGYYQVVIDVLNFNAGGSLNLFQNCSGGGDPEVDNDNDGTGNALSGDEVISQIVELFCDDTSDLPGPDENFFIDFCFFFDCSGPGAVDLSYPICSEAEANAPICDLVVLDSYCGSMNTNTSIGDQPDPLCTDGTGGAHNSSWFAFVAGEAGFQMEVVPFNCTTSGGFTGIQAGVYTDCTFTDAVFCDANCSVNAITIGGSGTTLVPGQTYYFFLDGCFGSVCDFEVNVIQGASTFEIPDPTGLACSVPDCGPVCPDSEITFTVEGLDLLIDYIWTIPPGSMLVGDGEQTGNTVVTETNELILAFPNTGTFTVIMNNAANGCDNTISVQAEVSVVQPDPIDFGEFTVCEHDLRPPGDGFGNGETDNNGDTFVGPAGEPWNAPNITMPGIDINVLYVDPEGCRIEQIVDIIQIDNSDREDVNLALCESELPFEYDQLTITGNGGGGFTNFNYTLLDTPAASGCDSFVTLTTIVLEHELELEANCTQSGVEISFSSEFMVPNTPDIVTYEWYLDENMNEEMDTDEEVTDSDGIDRILQVNGVGLYCVDVTLTHFEGELGEGTCLFTYCQDVNAVVPQVAFNVIDEECQDSTVVITFDGAVGSSAVFDWDFGNGTTANTEGPHNVNYAAPGKYYVTLSVDDNGCVSDEIIDSIDIIERLPAPLLLSCQSTPNSITITWNEIPGATGYEVTLLDGTAGVQTTPTTWEVTGVSVSDFTEISVVATTDGACAIGNASIFSCFAQDCDEPTFTFSPTRDTICLTTDVGLDTIFLDIINGTTPNTNSFTGPGIINEAEGVFDASVAGVGMHSITYNYTGDDNCMFSRNIIMHVFEQPVASFTTNVDTICITEAFTVTYDGGTTEAEYIWDFGVDVDMTGTGVGPFDITYSSIGMKTISLTVIKQECTSETIMRNVWVEAPLPELLIECDTDATSVNYSWNDIADEYEVIIDAVSQGMQTDTFWNSPVLSPGTSISIEVIANSGNQCPNSADTEECSATNCPGVSVEIDQLDDLLCIDANTASINLTYTVTGGFMNGSGVAVWSGNGVDPITGVYTPNASNTGPQTVTLNYSEGECDAAEVTATITILPTADFDGVETVCEGTSLTLNHTGAAGAGATYTWTVDGATVSGPDDESSITLSYDNSGMYEISLVVTSDDCDSEVFTQMVTIDETLLPPAIICADPNSTSITFQWGAVDGATEYEILIDGVLQGVQTGTTFEIMSLNPNDERTITVTAISDGTCPSSSNIRLCQAIDCPATEIVPTEIPPTFCEGDMISYDIDFMINGGFMDGSGVMTFNGPSTDPITGVVDIATLNPGSYTVYLDYSEGPCDTRDSVSISVVELPTPTLDFAPVICETETLTVTYSGQNIIGAVVEIEATGNPVEMVTAGGSTFEWSTDGIYEIIATVTIGDCMISSETYTVTVEPQLLEPVIMCAPTNSGIELSWDAIDCASMYIVTIDNIAQPAQVETTYSIVGLSPQTSVDITVEAITECACSNSSASTSCETVDCDPVEITVINNDPDCLNNLPSTVQLDVTLSGAIGGGTGTWSGANITPDGIFNYDESGIGVHLITYDYSENGCDYTKLDSVIVFDPPVVELVPSDPLCFDSNDGSIAFTLSGGDGNYEVTVNVDPAQPDFPQTFTADDVITGLSDGTYTFTVIDGNLCNSEDERPISSPTQPTFSILGPPVIAVGTFGDLSLDLGTLAIEEITNITWTNGTDVLCDGIDCFDLSVSPSVNSLYCVDITLEGGCIINNCLPIQSEFISILNVSNIFSPDGDGSNDNLVIQTNNPDMVASYIRIFDRWGNMVFNVEEPWAPYSDMNYPGWDGTYKGQKLNPGVYVYVFEFIDGPDATPEVRVGDITIIR